MKFDCPVNESSHDGIREGSAQVDNRGNKPGLEAEAASLQ